MRGYGDMERKTIFLSAMAGVGGCIGFVLGGWSTGLYILGGLILLDYFSGVLKAIYEKKVSSNIGLKGIIKKLGFVIGIIVANFVDILSGQHIFRDAFVFMLIGNEGISVLENLSAIGVPSVTRIFGFFNNLKENSAGKDGDVK